jgi:hypothetical protein
MKKTVLSLALGSATLFLGPAYADDEKASPVPPSSLDANQAELAAAHENMLKENANPQGGRRARLRAAVLKRFDKNGDGQLDEAERAEVRKYFLGRFDTNGDGRLDEDERAAMREEFKAEAKAQKLKN